MSAPFRNVLSALMPFGERPRNATSPQRFRYTCGAPIFHPVNTVHPRIGFPDVRLPSRLRLQILWIGRVDQRSSSVASFSEPRFKAVLLLPGLETPATDGPRASLSFRSGHARRDPGLKDELLLHMGFLVPRKTYGVKCV